MPTVLDIREAALLVSPKALSRASLGELSLDPEDPGDREQMVDALAEAEGELERYLDRTLLVHPVSVWPAWAYDPKAASTARRWGAWLEEWPLSGVSDAGVTLGRDLAGGQQAFRASTVASFDAYAGYRGDHHELAGLKALDGLADLAELPPVLPSVLRGVIVDLAFIRLDQRKHGTLGGKRKTQTIAQSSTVTTEGYRRTADEEILERAKGYRRVTL